MRWIPIRADSSCATVDAHSTRSRRLKPQSQTRPRLLREDMAGPGAGAVLPKLWQPSLTPFRSHKSNWNLSLAARLLRKRLERVEGLSGDTWNSAQDQRRCRRGMSQE